MTDDTVPDVIHQFAEETCAEFDRQEHAAHGGGEADTAVRRVEFVLSALTNPKYGRGQEALREIVKERDKRRELDG